MRYYKCKGRHILLGFDTDTIYAGSCVVVPFTDMTITSLALSGDTDWEEVSEEEYLKQEEKLPVTTNIKPYYKGKSSLYLFAEEYGLNSWEFDCIKRIVRCRHKGSWLEDLEKTKGVIDIYINECKAKYDGKE
jgi:hypothetical protein